MANALPPPGERPMPNEIVSDNDDEPNLATGPISRYPDLALDPPGPPSHSMLFTRCSSFALATGALVLCTGVPTTSAYNSIVNERPPTITVNCTPSSRAAVNDPVTSDASSAGSIPPRPPRRVP